MIEGKVFVYVFVSFGCKKWDICVLEVILYVVGGKLIDIYGNVF